MGEFGQSGYSGINGTSGKSGFSGIGIQGLSGTSGQNGQSGTSGAIGFSGFSGTGTSGTSGFSGTYSGWSGASGQVGPQGIPGYSGSSGFSGSSPTAYDCENFIMSGNPLRPGIVGDITIGYDATIVGVQVLAMETGSITLDIWRSAYGSFPATATQSICGANLPEISNGYKYQDLTVAGWLTTVNRTDTLRINVQAAGCISQCTVSLLLQRR